MPLGSVLRLVCFETSNILLRVRKRLAEASETVR